MIKILRYWPLFLAILITQSGCKGPGLPGDEELKGLNRLPLIFPDYTAITIPYNIAPLNFRMEEEGEHFKAVLEGDQGTL